MKLKASIGAIAFVTVTTASASNLVTNGDFSSGQTGWTLTGNQSYQSFPDYWKNGAVGSDAFISQTLTTIPGNLYNLSFDANIPWGTVTAYFNGATVLSTGTTTIWWQHFSVIAQASGISTVLTFGTYNNPEYNVLDNVSVTAVVPEPESYSMLLAGMGLIGTIARRRKKTSLMSGGKL